MRIKSFHIAAPLLLLAASPTLAGEVFGGLYAAFSTLLAGTMPWTVQPPST